MRASGAKRRRGLINIGVDAFLAASSDGDFDALLAVPRSCRSGAIDPNVWSGRALQENFRRVGECVVLHQCIRPLIGAFVLRAIMGISARAISLADRPQRDHSGHQSSHAPGRPILHLVCNPLADLGR